MDHIQMGEAPTALGATESISENRQRVAIGEGASSGSGSGGPSNTSLGNSGGSDPPPADLGGGLDDMQKRLDELRR